MKIPFEVTNIEIIQQPHGKDRVYLITDQADPIDPQYKLEFLLFTTIGKGPSFVTEHFPNVPTEILGYTTPKNPRK